MNTKQQFARRVNAVKFVRLSGNFQLEAEAFRREMAGCKLVFLCNPNNPTSKLIPQKTLTEILDNALEQGILVFLDEDFLEFIDDEKSRTMISKIEQVPQPVCAAFIHKTLRPNRTTMRLRYSTQRHNQRHAVRKNPMERQLPRSTRSHRCTQR